MSNPNYPGQNPHGQPNPYGAQNNPYGQQAPQQNPYAMPNPAHQIRPDLGQMGNMQRHTGSSEERSQAFMTKVFGWMAMGLGLTGVVAWWTFSSGFFMTLMPYFTPLMFLQLGLVFGLSFFVKKMPAPVAIGAFLLYAVSMGLTLSVIFAIYQLGSIANVFFVTFLTFGFMFVYGWVTKRDLTSVGNIAFMGLIGIILAGIGNRLFGGGEMMSLAISAIGVVVFVALTAYDAQKIKQLGAYGFQNGETEQKMAIIGALTLYLDFINLFLSLLRLMGDRR